MKNNSDDKRPSIRLTEDILWSLGMTCILMDEGAGEGRGRSGVGRPEQNSGNNWLDQPRAASIDATRSDATQNHVRVRRLGIAGRRAVGEKTWFRNTKEADRVMGAMLSRCFEARKTRDGLLVELPVEKALGLVAVIARSLGITPIQHCDLETTFDSISGRIDRALRRMEYDGSMKMLSREYATLRRGTSAGTIGTKLPSYREWAFNRLKTELLKCTDLVHITRL